MNYKYDVVAIILSVWNIKAKLIYDAMILSSSLYPHWILHK